VNPAQHLKREAAADDRTRLCQSTRFPWKVVDSREKKALQRCGNGFRCARTQSPCPLVLEASVFHERAEHLLEIQRVSVRAGDDLDPRLLAEPTWYEQRQEPARILVRSGP